MKKFFKELRKKIRASLFPEPKEVQSVFKGRVIISTIDKVEGIAVLWAVDLGKTFHVTGVDTSEEISNLLDNIALDKFSVDPVHLRALRITQRKGGKK